MVDHAAIIPSFRDFSSYRAKPSVEPEPLRKPTVLEVDRVLSESPAGKLGKAIATEGWPWLERTGFMDSVIPGIAIHSLGGSVPFQADGIWGPYEWYYRERGGYSDLRLSPIGTFPGAGDALYSASGEVPEFSGTEGWLPRFLELWARLERAPFLYSFGCKEILVSEGENGVEFLDTGEVSEQLAWGHSPEEARHSANELRTFYEEILGWGESTQRERLRLMEIAEDPSKMDDRVYPLQSPDFAVHLNGLSLPEELQHFAVSPSSTDS